MQTVGSKTSIAISTLKRNHTHFKKDPKVLNPSKRMRFSTDLSSTPTPLKQGHILIPLQVIRHVCKVNRYDYKTDVGRMMERLKIVGKVDGYGK
ncbi:MAG: hypothetical protein ACJAU0_000772 [Flavobacteriales bacterium]